MNSEDYEKQFKSIIVDAENLYDKLRGLEDPELLDRYQGDLEDIINDPSIGDAMKTLTTVKNAIVEFEEVAEANNNLE